MCHGLVEWVSTQNRETRLFNLMEAMYNHPAPTTSGGALAAVTARQQGSGHNVCVRNATTAQKCFISHACTNIGSFRMQLQQLQQRIGSNRNASCSDRVLPSAINIVPRWQSSRLQCRVAHLRGGPATPTPDYSDIDNQPLQAAVMTLFRRKMALVLEEDVSTTGYQAIVDLARRLNTKYSSFREIQVKTVKVLTSLMPSWLPAAFKVMFSQPFPSFACMINAWATAFTCQWLMGKCTVNDVEVDGGKVAKGHGVKIERCRYLEQTGCASVCVNSCKIPTQEFFAVHMGLPLTMTPNYEDFSCQFAFGKTPEPQSQDVAFSSPCFTQCPTRRAGAQLAATSSSSAASPGLPAPPAALVQQGVVPRCHKIFPEEELA